MRHPVIILQALSLIGLLLGGLLVDRLHENVLGRTATIPVEITGSLG